MTFTRRKHLPSVKDKCGNTDLTLVAIVLSRILQEVDVDCSTFIHDEPEEMSSIHPSYCKRRGWICTLASFCLRQSRLGLSGDQKMTK